MSRMAWGCLFLAILGAGGAEAEGFSGSRADWASLVRAGCRYVIDDDPGMEVKNGVVSDVLLYLVYGEDVPSCFRPDEKALPAVHGQMLAFVRDGVAFGGDHDRVLASMAEAYLILREKGIFTKEEQQLLEEDLFRRWAYDNAREVMGHQYVPHALAAVVGHVLATSRTGVDYSDDVRRLWEYADTAFDFGDSPGPIENSAHYAPFVYISMARISLYANGHGGVFPESHKANLALAVNRILDLYPHNGYGLSFGTTWSRDHVRQLFSFLIGAACFLSDGQPEHVRLARQAKWTALTLFGYSSRLPKEGYAGDGLVDSQQGHTRGEPIWLWMYSLDDLEPLAPELAEHGCKVVYGDLGNSYDKQMRHSGRADKVVFRDGWGEEAFYLLVDLAPTCGKNQPHAGSIVNVVYGSGVFGPGKTRDVHHKEWRLRSVLDSRSAPDSIGHTDASVGLFFAREGFSAARVDSSVGGWLRYVCFPQDPSYAVVFDSAPTADVAYWHFLTDGAPSWEADGIVLNRAGRCLDARFPNNLDWHRISHETVSTWDSPEWEDQFWYAGDPAESVEVEARGAWLTVLCPLRWDRLRIVALDPQNAGVGRYPGACGVKVKGQGISDCVGFQPSARAALAYGDKVETDAELFWLREDADGLAIGFWSASVLRIHLTVAPQAIELDGNELARTRDWTWRENRLEIRPPVPGGLALVRIEPTEGG